MRRKRWINLFGMGLLLSLPGAAQRIAAPLDTVKQTGFYRIVLDPGLVAACREDLGDLRIRATGGQYIPYVLITDVNNPLNAGFLPLPNAVIRQKDSSNKYSYIWLSFPNAYRIERLSFVIRQPILYKRMVRVSNPDADRYMQPIATFSIDPTDTAFRIPAVKTRHLQIAIANEDNVPLVVSKVVAAQSGIFMLTHLEKGGEYVIDAGDSLAKAPDYDLHYFTDSLQQRPLDILVCAIHQQPAYPGKVIGDSAGTRVIDVARRASDNKRSTILLWSVLVLVLLLLLYFSIKMVKAIVQKENK